ncbi:hypothetical protein O181_127467 [Austropuccinia psidii MF-1]|uniref:Uncharacterized protein n=1 Tax=Austropuccinia psidii MF-1 TaxID=1389203 RepID=A0A9Q3Q9I5_9BASI|nr:hypothetical protein [Austropuccinia psidii MF-1]
MNSYLQVKKFMGAEKTEELLKGWTPMYCKGQFQQIKDWLKNQSMLSEDQKKKLDQGKENSQVEAPQASTSHKSASTSAKQSQANTKDQQEGQAKGKGKGKAQVEQALPAGLQDYQEREDSHGQCVQYGKKSGGIQKQGRGKIEPILSKEVDLVKLLNQIETCAKEIITKFKKFEYIQKKLGNEILQVKESQKTIIGLENVNEENILSLVQICARIESKVTLLNQPDENSISFIARQLKELRIQVQNLETSTGHNASLFQEKLEKSVTARLEVKEDIQSSINNISLKNDLPRQSTTILDRNVLNLNNDLHHTISSNAEVETACIFKDIPRLEEWPTFSGEGVSACDSKPEHKHDSQNTINQWYSQNTTKTWS